MNTVTNSDGELLAGYAREGSESAFRTLVSRHVHLVFATALRQAGNRQLAEEITQTVFVVLARKAPSLARHETIAGWLHRTALLESRARIRAELRRQRREDIAAALAASDPPVTTPVDQDPVVQLLDEGLMGLGDAERSAVLLRFLEGRTFADVGRSLGVSEDAARKRVDRAIERLSGFFKGRGFSSAASASSLVPVLLSQGAPPVPAKLAATAAASGLAAGAGGGTVASAVAWMMRMTPAKGLVAGAMLCLAPAGWHVSASRADAALHQAERKALAVQKAALASARAELQSLQEQLTEQNAPGGGGGRAELGFGGGGGFGVALEPAPGLPPWDDQSPLIRISKRFLASQQLYGLRDGRGHLSETLIQVLQLTPDEVAGVEAALARFIDGCHDVEQQVMQIVEPEPSDLQGFRREETRVFRFGDLHDAVGQLRSRFFQEAKAILANERFERFKRSIHAWMPIDDSNVGFGNSREIFTEARRERYHRSSGQQPHAAGAAVLGWSVVLEREGTAFQSTRRVDEIPAYLVPHLQDWIEEARRVNAQPLPKPGGQP